MLRNKSIFVGLLLAAPVAVMAQKPLPSDTTKKDTSHILKPGKDTSDVKKKDIKPVKPTAIKPYKEVIPDSAITKKGLFWVHKVEDKWFFEIPNSILGNEIMVVNRFSKVPSGANVYGGEIISQQTIKFEKGPDKNVFIRYIAEINVADSTSKIYKAVQNSSLNPLVGAFPIQAYGKDSATSVIDVTDFLKGDNQLTSVSSNRKKSLGLSNIASDRSYVADVKAFPINVEIKTVKTFNANPPTPMPFFGGSNAFDVANATGVATLELNSSFLLLPKVPMAKRLFDPRVGYFADDYTVYSDDQQKVDNQVFAVRWRLEPKDIDRARWEKGELVEPKKQIVYYIDPATPKQWRPYLIAGINDWQKAFEKAGFKNAIVGKEWPENDTTMSMEDARYSVIRYFASPTENAYGPNVHDPRSGEILESHVGWYHNVMKLVHDWYMVQASAIDPKARKMKFDDELMGQLIRFVSSHEIGHTLGLRHNMGSSSRTPVELLRNKKWVEEHGHTASIMDYARFNYVAQPEDNVSEKGIFPRIGDYDDWAIRWGYSYTGGKTPKEDHLINNKWIVEALSKNPRLWFGGEGRNGDPRAQTEDLGDDNMKASAYGIKNLQREMLQLPEWTKEDGDVYQNLSDLYTQVLGQFTRYMGHVLTNVGGIEETFKSVEQPGAVYAPTAKDKQHRAVLFLNEQIFATPEWLLNKDILAKINNPGRDNNVKTLQVNVLNALLSNDRVAKIINSNAFYGADTLYTPNDLFADVHSGVWGELSSGSAVSDYRRNLQEAYVNRLINILKPADNASAALPFQLGGSTPSDLKALARKELKSLRVSLKQATSPDEKTKDHYANLADVIDSFFDDKK